MQKNLNPLQQQQLQQQQQQRLAALYAMQQQQQQQQQHGRMGQPPYGQIPPGMYANAAAMMSNDLTKINPNNFRPPTQPSQTPQGVYIRPPGMIQNPNAPGMPSSINGMPPKYMNSPIHQQQLHQLQQQQQLHQQPPQPHPQSLPPHQQQQQQQQPQPQQQPPQMIPPAHLGGNNGQQPMMIPSVGTPNVNIRGIPHPYPNHPHQQQQQQPPPHGGVANIPPIETTIAESPSQKENLNQYQERDKQYQKILDVQHKRHVQLAQEKKREIEISSIERRTRTQGPNGLIATFGPGYQGYGNGSTGFQSRIIYPREKKRLRRTPLLKFSMDDMKDQATKEDNLVPIRLEFEADGYKLRDTFTWNLNETLVTPEQFADIMCEDLRLPPGSFVPQISRTIREQVQDYYLHASSMVTNETSEVEEDNEKLKNSTPLNIPTIKNENQSDNISINDENDIKKKQKKNVELRMLIKLDITVGHKELVDQFEWDISCPQNSPEEFAEILASDLGLGGEFKTAIAHSIREQVHVYTKSLLLVGHEFDGPVVDDDLKHSFLPSIKSVVRDTDALQQFTPNIFELTEAELQKNEKIRLREARRKRRQTRGRRGIILPDREPLKTSRTSHETQHEQELTDEQFFANMNGGNMNLNGARGGTPVQEAMHSQRRSALRARANIAAEAAGHHHTGSQTPPQTCFLSSGF